jgi:hypothetical protein
MSRFAHAMLVGSAVVAAFFGGYLLHLKPRVANETAIPPAAANKAPEPAVALGPSPAQTPIILIPPIEPPPMPEPVTLVADSKRTTTEFPPTPILNFDSPPPAPRADDAINPNDPTFLLMKRQLGIKTTSILADLPPLGPAPGMDPQPLTESPKLDIPPRVISTFPVKLVNKRDLLLDFEVTRLGSSKIAAVELWTTRDGGQTWSCADKMAGCKSPFKTRLGSEGEYGFRLVFESESGLRTAEPSVGTSPDMLVELDVSAPKVSLVGVEPAGPPGKVWINWKMSDSHLDAEATQLEYSTDGCDWRSIELPSPMHTGEQYFQDWTVPDDVPAHVLIRITARDFAGNVTTIQTPHKVLIDLVAPEGKLTGVRVEGSEAEMGPMPRLIGRFSRQSDFPFKLHPGSAESHVVVLATARRGRQPDEKGVDRMLNALLIGDLEDLMRENDERMRVLLTAAQIAQP